MFSAGRVAATWAKGFGLRLDDWQVLVLDMLLAERGDGRWAAADAGCWVPRQNGKGGVIEALVLWHQFVLGTPSIIWSAHNYDIANKAFKRYERLLRNNDALFEELVGERSVKRGMGRQEVHAATGSQVTWNTRSSSGLRGTDAVGLLILDEAQELNDDHMSAVSPTLAARSLETPGPQTVYFGTPPTNPLAWVYTLRAMAEEAAPRVAWANWGLDLPRREDGLLEESDLDDRANWYRANPALGVRIAEDWMAGQRGKLRQAFAVEHLGVWPPGVELAGKALDRGRWDACQIRPLEVGPRLVLSLDAWGGQWAVGRAWELPDGSRTAVEIAREGADVRLGAQQFVEMAASLNPVAVVVDTYGPVASVIPDLRAAGVQNLVELNSSDVVDAWVRFAGDVATGRIAHPGAMPGEVQILEAAVDGAVTRRAGERLVLHRAASTEAVYALMAVVLAAWGVASTPNREPTFVVL